MLWIFDYVVLRYFMLAEVSVDPRHCGDNLMWLRRGLEIIWHRIGKIIKVVVPLFNSHWLIGLLGLILKKASRSRDNF